MNNTNTIDEVKRKIPKHNLQGPQKIKLFQELQNHWDSYVVKYKPDYIMAADYFQKKCGFKVTDGNIRGMVTNMNLIWPNRKRPEVVDDEATPTGGGWASRIVALETIAHTHEREIHKLKAQLDRIVNGFSILQTI